MTSLTDELNDRSLIDSLEICGIIVLAILLTFIYKLLTNPLASPVYWAIILLIGIYFKYTFDTEFPCLSIKT